MDRWTALLGSHNTGISVPISCLKQLVPLSKDTKLSLLTQETEQVSENINDSEYNKILDTASKSLRSSKKEIIEAAKRLENL